MLRACRRVLKPRGPIAFYTIYIPLGPPEPERREAAHATHAGNYSRSAPDRLLATAGFTQIETRDLTEEFLATAIAWRTAWKAHEEEARRELGDSAYEEAHATRANNIAMVNRGLLRRALFTARRP